MQTNHPALIESPAHTWFLRHLPEIQSRTRARVSRLPSHEREEATAEILGTVFKASVSAAGRGTLHRVTAFHAVWNAARQFKQGRRLGGYSSTDVSSEATQVKRRARTVSLSTSIAPSRPVDEDPGDPASLAEVLADRRDLNPFEQVRKNLDYGAILQREHVSDKARRLFRLLSEVRGFGHVNAIAQVLEVSPGRVCQLKGELADALAKHGYAPV